MPEDPDFAGDPEQAQGGEELVHRPIDSARWAAGAPAWSVRTSSPPVSRSSSRSCPFAFSALPSSPPVSRLFSPARISRPSSLRSEEHTSALQSLMRISYAVLGLKKKNKKTTHIQKHIINH